MLLILIICTTLTLQTVNFYIMCNNIFLSFTFNLDDQSINTKVFYGTKRRKPGWVNCCDLSLTQLCLSVYKIIYKNLSENWNICPTLIAALIKFIVLITCSAQNYLNDICRKIRSHTVSSQIKMEKTRQDLGKNFGKLVK